MPSLGPWPQEGLSEHPRQVLTALIPKPCSTSELPGSVEKDRDPGCTPNRLYTTTQQGQQKPHLTSQA